MGLQRVTRGYYSEFQGVNVGYKASQLVTESYGVHRRL